MTKSFEDRFYHRGPDKYVVTEVGFLVCQNCGCLIMEGHRDAHDDFEEKLYAAWAVSVHRLPDKTRRARRDDE